MLPLILIIVATLVQTCMSFSTKFIHSSLVTRHGTLHPRFKSTISISTIMSIKTGKDGKPASSSDEDLELTRSIIMAHQEKYSDSSLSPTVAASSPIATSPQVAAIAQKLDSPYLMNTSPLTTFTSPILWFIVALGAMALWKPQVFPILMTRVPRWLHK